MQLPVIRPPLHNDAIWLIRPDGYVACSSNNTNDIANYLERLVRPNSH